MNNDIELDSFDDEIDLKKLLLVIWNQKKFVTSLTSIFAVMSVVYALSLPNEYTSSALLAPTSEENSLSSQIGQFSGFASLAGIGLPNASTSKSQEAVERMQSFEFFSKYFLPNIKLENLMAVKKWVPEDNILIYDKDSFDIKTKKWIRNVSFPKKVKPSNQEAFEEAYRKILSISMNKNTGFISMSIEHKSPEIAKTWLDLIILNINESMRELDKQNAQNSIDFLNESTKLTTVRSINDVISVLLESQMQTLMLANSQKDYVFKIIESPIAPEKKSGPSRSVICILLTILGGIFSVSIILIKHYIKSSKS